MTQAQKQALIGAAVGIAFALLSDKSRTVAQNIAMKATAGTLKTPAGIAGVALGFLLK